jgi:hypothetical protein
VPSDLHCVVPRIANVAMYVGGGGGLVVVVFCRIGVVALVLLHWCCRIGGVSLVSFCFSFELSVISFVGLALKYYSLKHVLFYESAVPLWRDGTLVRWGKSFVCVAPCLLLHILCVTIHTLFTYTMYTPCTHPTYPDTLTFFIPHRWLHHSTRLFGTFLVCVGDVGQCQPSRFRNQ